MLGDTVITRAPKYIYLFHFLQEKIRNPKVRNFLKTCIKLCLPKKEIRVSDESKLFLENGRVDLCDVFFMNYIAVIKNELSSRKVFDRWDLSKTLFEANHPPKNTHVADYMDVQDIEAVIEIANDKKVLELVDAYLDGYAIIDSIMAWWSYPTEGEPQEAELFHRDNDGISFVKLFIYLTDVDEESGPHVYVPKSHSSSKGLEIRRYQDEEIFSIFNEQEIITGKAGSSFLEDTYGFHKGLPPISKKRLLLQIRYSLFPTVFMSRTKSLKAGQVVRLKGYDQYRNKLVAKL